MAGLKEAISLIDNKEYDKAKRILNKLISKKTPLTTRLMAMVLLANVLKVEGKYSKLSNLYDKILEYLPSYQIYMNAGANRFLMGDYKKAIKMYIKSAKLAKNDTDKITALIYGVIGYLLIDDIKNGKRLYLQAEKISKLKSKKILTAIIKDIFSKNKNVPPTHKDKILSLLSKL